MVTEPRGISLDEARTRGARIRLVLTDCDGVLTDGGVYYGADGEVLKRFSMRDGMGVALLRKEGMETGIVSGELSASIQRRAEKLRLEHVHLGIADKDQELERILAKTGLAPSEIAYIGDDVNDMGVLARLSEEGLSGAPPDAVPRVLDIVHFVGSVPGGHGAFREFADWILSLRRLHKV